MDSKFIKVLFPSSMNKEGITETCWATPIRYNLFWKYYKVDNILLVTEGVAFGDIIQVIKRGNVYEFISVIKRSGHSLLQVKVSSKYEKIRLMDILRENGCEVEGTGGNTFLIGVDIPRNISVKKIKDLIKEESENPLIKDLYIDID